MRVSSSEPDKDIVFWNASTGEGYAFDDHACPLRVGTIASQDNIWANIQESDNPYEMNFNLADPKSWRPFFSAKYPKSQMETCQIQQLEYTPPNTEFLEQLERQILNTLKVFEPFSLKKKKYSFNLFEKWFRLMFKFK